MSTLFKFTPQILITLFLLRTLHTSYEKYKVNPSILHKKQLEYMVVGLMVFFGLLVWGGFYRVFAV